MSPTLFHDVLLATGDTLYMVIASTFFAVMLGFPLGTWLFACTKLKPNRLLQRVLNALINISRSIPFIILLVALIPVTRLIIGTSIGVHAAIVPLTLGAVPFFARLVDNAYQRLPSGLLDAGYAMGADSLQMIRYILFPEAKPALIQAVTLTAITLVNYSAMAGTVGGGGLGDLAIRYGYQRFDVMVMLITVCFLIIIVQLIQFCGDRMTTYLSRGKFSCV